MDAAPLRIGLIATRGRMAEALRAAMSDAPDLVENADHARVLIDFSAPAALPASLDRACTTSVPIVIGTTGLDATADTRIARAAQSIAVLCSANMSLGVTVLAHLVEQAAARLDWDIEILDMHHAGKVDAPSGTALLLGARATAGRRADVLGGDHDRASARVPGAIGYASLRGGTVAGDHDVILAGPSERLILSHRAESRAIFARGALAAARWIADKPPGRYTMNDVLGL